MSDFRFAATLDDKAFARALERMHKDTRASSARIEKELKGLDRVGRDAAKGIGRIGAGLAGFATVERAISMARTAVRTYDEATGGAVSETNSLKQAIDEFNISLGRDLSSATGQAGNVLSGLVRNINSVRQALVDALATVAGGDPQAVDAEIKKQESQRLQRGVDERAQAMGRGLEIGRLSESGDIDDQHRAAVLRADQRREQERDKIEAMAREANETNRRLGLQGADRIQVPVAELRAQVDEQHKAEIKAADDALAAKLRGMREENTARRQAGEERRTQAHREAQEEEERRRKQQEGEQKKEAERAEARASALKSLEFDKRQREIGLMQTRGQEKQAALKQIELDVDRDRQAILENENLTLDEKKQKLQELDRFQRDALEAERGLQAREEARDRQGPGRVLEAGLGGSAIARAQVFGGATRVDPVARNTKDIPEGIRDIRTGLRELINLVGSGGGLVPL